MNFINRLGLAIILALIVALLTRDATPVLQAASVLVIMIGGAMLASGELR